MSIPTRRELAVELVKRDDRTERCAHVENDAVCVAPIGHSEGEHKYEPIEKVIPFL